MADINVVVLGGRLTAKPELKFAPSGDAVCNLRMASNQKWKGKDGEWKEETTFINAEIWGKSAEACAEYLDKGSPVVVTGRLKQKRWETKEGDKRERIDIAAQQVTFMGGKKGTAEEAAEGAPPAKDDDIPF